ncbi:hypothetical protein [Chroococcidiopsis cubana]|nr:hypothetical protein [Chroococcidiopsis cubana]
MKRKLSVCGSIGNVRLVILSVNIGGEKSRQLQLAINLRIRSKLINAV